MSSFLIQLNILFNDVLVSHCFLENLTTVKLTEKYDHLPLLVESMRWNSNIDFVVINIIDNSFDADEIKALAKSVSNLHIEVLSIAGKIGNSKMFI